LDGRGARLRTRRGAESPQRSRALWRFGTEHEDYIDVTVLRDSGLTPIRFSHWQVKHEPDHALNILRRTAAHLRGSLHPH